MENKERFYNILIVVIFSLFFFAAIWATHDLGFQLNDDVQIMTLISGQYNGAISLHGICMIYPVTLILQVLYLMFNTVNWYAVFLLGFECISFMILMYKIIKKMNGYITKIMILLLFSFLIIEFDPSFLNLITYTEVAIFMMTCALILFLLHENKKHEKIIIIAGIGLAFSIRIEACCMILPFFIPAGIYRSYKNKTEFKNCLIMAIEIIFMLAIIILSNKIIDDATGWQDYNRYNIYRVRYYDYYSERIDELPENIKNKMLEEAGISENDYKIIKSYFVRFRW